MQTLWILLSTFLFTLSLPRQVEKPAADLSHPVTIFEKPFYHDKNKKFLVTCEEVPFTPEGLAQIAQLQQAMLPENRRPYHRYAYSYFTVTHGTQRKLLWTEYFQLIGGIGQPGKANAGSSEIEVYDLALQDNTLWILYQQMYRTKVNIVRLNPRRVASPASSKKVEDNGVQSPIGAARVLEEADISDGVNGGRILEPILNGEVTVQLTHIRTLNDGSPRITTYHQTRNTQARNTDLKEFWAPDPTNVYRPYEKTGVQLLNERR
jgi:hypothetical protein